jgi:hypothetical protein
MEKSCFSAALRVAAIFPPDAGTAFATVKSSATDPKRELAPASWQRTGTSFACAINAPV